MPKKSRKSRLKYKRQSSPQSLAVKESRQPPQSISALPEQASAAKSPVRTAEQPIRYPYVVSDLKRTLITAAVMFALLFILYFILR